MLRKALCIIALVASGSVANAAPNSCQRAIDDCQRSISNLYDRLNRQQQHGANQSTIDRIQERITDENLECTEEINAACQGSGII